jgi:hypothetical protein
MSSRLTTALAAAQPRGYAEMTVPVSPDSAGDVMVFSVRCRYR